jgi:hypothetical protein
MWGQGGKSKVEWICSTANCPLQISLTNRGTIRGRLTICAEPELGGRVVVAHTWPPAR